MEITLRVGNSNFSDFFLDDKSGAAVVGECLTFLKSSLEMNEDKVVQIRNPEPDDGSVEQVPVRNTKSDGQAL